VHQAKGLEWDSVVVALPDDSEKFRPIGQWVQVTRDISMDSPLAGRQLRFWPETLLNSAALKERIMNEPSQVQRTRAGELHDTMTFGLKRIASDEEVLQEAGQQRQTVTEPESARILANRGHPSTGKQLLPATFKASHRLPDERLRATTRVEKIAVLGPPLVSHGGMDWDRVGDCVHAYLAVPYRSLDKSGKLRIATRLIERWGVADVLTPELIIEAGDRWTAWHDECYPDATVRTEVPFTWTSPQHQRAQGWLDQLTQLASGEYVVIDHKSYPGERPEEQILSEYTGQLQVYRDALRDSIGVDPREILIHLPLRGEVYAVYLPPAEVVPHDSVQLLSERL